MPMEVRLESLRDKHHEVDMALQEEAKRPLPDVERISYLKREKLQLKDEMTRLEQVTKH